MIYLTDFSTASMRLNLNNVAKSSAEPNSFELCRDVVKNVQWTLVSRRNPTQGTQCGVNAPLLFSVLKGRDIETIW